MPQVTLQTLRESVIFRADLPTAEPRRYTDTQVNDLVNASVRRLQGNLLTWWGDDYFTIEDEQTLTADTNTLPLPADTKLKTVVWKRSDSSNAQGRTSSVKLGRIDFADIHRFTYDGNRVWETQDPPRWWVEFEDPGYVLRFTYGSTVQQTVLIYRVKEISPFTVDGDVITLEWGWEDWIVLDVMVRIRQRDKQDYQDILDERLRLEDKIRQQAPEKGESEVRAVRNVYPENFYGPLDIRRFHW